MRYDKHNPLTVIELFAGYGSQAMALERLRRDFPPFDYKVLAVSEIEPSALRAYEAVHGHCPNLGDVSKIDWEAHPGLRGVGLVTYSFPCTDISNAGRQEGFAKDSGTRSSLLWECEKCFRALRPRFLLMENVKALTQKKFMPLFNEWIKVLDGLGYTSRWQVLNAKDYLVPQNRERVFMVSALDDGFRYSFPAPMELTRCVEDYMEPAEAVGEEYYISQERVTGKVLSDILDQPNVRAEMELLYHLEWAFRQKHGRWPTTKELDAYESALDD